MDGWCAQTSQPLPRSGASGDGDGEAREPARLVAVAGVAGRSEQGLAVVVPVHRCTGTRTGWVNLATAYVPAQLPRHEDTNPCTLLLLWTVVREKKPQAPTGKQFIDDEDETYKEMGPK